MTKINVSLYSPSSSGAALESAGNFTRLPQSEGDDEEEEEDHTVAAMKDKKHSDGTRK